MINGTVKVRHHREEEDYLHNKKVFMVLMPLTVPVLRRQ